MLRIWMKMTMMMLWIWIEKDNNANYAIYLMKAFFLQYVILVVLNFLVK